MAQKNKAQLQAAIDALYLDCGTECITPEAVNTFEKDKTDSYAILNEDNNFLGTATWTKQIREHKGTDITAGSNLTLNNNGNYFFVNGGTTAINSISSRQHGTRVAFMFDEDQTLTHSANLLLPNNRDYNVQSGEVVQFVSEGGGVWKFVSGSYQGLTLISGRYTPTYEFGGFTEVNGLSAIYSVQGNVMTCTHRFIVTNGILSSNGAIVIPPPTEVAIDETDEYTVSGVAQVRSFAALANFDEITISQASGKIVVQVNLITAFSPFELTVVTQSLLA